MVYLAMSFAVLSGLCFVLLSWKKHAKLAVQASLLACAIGFSACGMYCIKPDGILTRAHVNLTIALFVISALIYVGELLIGYLSKDR